MIFEPFINEWDLVIGSKLLIKKLLWEVYTQVMDSNTTYSFLQALCSCHAFNCEFHVAIPLWLNLIILYYFQITSFL